MVFSLYPNPFHGITDLNSDCDFASEAKLDFLCHPDTEHFFSAQTYSVYGPEDSCSLAEGQPGLQVSIGKTLWGQ